MRYALPLSALLVAAMLAGCDSDTSPEPPAPAFDAVEGYWEGRFDSRAGYVRMYVSVNHGSPAADSAWGRMGYGPMPNNTVGQHVHRGNWPVADSFVTVVSTALNGSGLPDVPVDTLRCAMLVRPPAGEGDMMRCTERTGAAAVFERLIAEPLD